MKRSTLYKQLRLVLPAVERLIYRTMQALQDVGVMGSWLCSRANSVSRAPTTRASPPLVHVRPKARP
jgi:hypothetical protein